MWDDWEAGGSGSGCMNLSNPKMDGIRFDRASGSNERISRIPKKCGILGMSENILGNVGIGYLFRRA
jgi:hypothetical protein